MVLRYVYDRSLNSAVHKRQNYDHIRTVVSIDLGKDEYKNCTMGLTLFTFICSYIFLLNKKIVFSYHKVLLTNISFTFRRESTTRYSLCCVIFVTVGQFFVLKIFIYFSLIINKLEIIDLLFSVYENWIPRKFFFIV